MPFPFRRSHRFYFTGQAAAFAAAAVFFLTICLSSGFSDTAQAQSRPSTPPQGVAVLPFTNITGNQADDWIGAGIAETMTAGLRGVDGLAIIGRESVLDALQAEMDLASSDTIQPTALELARRIGATWIVGGGYQRAGDLLRVTARVVDVSTGAVVQAVRVDGRADDIFGLQDRLVDALYPALTTVLASTPPPAPAPPVARANARTPSDAIMTPPPEAPPISTRASAAVPAATTPPLPSNTAPANTPPAASAAAAAVADASSLASLADAAAITTAYGGPPPPMAPSVISRDERGGATVRAVRINGAIELDGRLAEEIYGLVPAMGGFLQQEPIEGAPTTEPTEAWIFFDDETLYVSARCYVSEPERMVVTELRRDMINISQNENFVVIFDTFLDRRNGIYFQTTPAGAVRDQLSTDEGSPNESWNTVWDVKTSRFDGGWTLEMAIPFKSLRYRSAGPQVWGLQFRRTIRHKNEQTYLTRVPAAYSLGGIYRLSVAATLVGLETPASSMNLEIKPYVSSSLTTDLAAANPFSDDFKKNWGVDFKYGLTRSLTADFTYNTDFAQVEEDLQQVNLTRFSLFFPEKREFFLEGQGIFNFGGVQTGGQGGGGNSDVPVMFFSRRIGLSQGQAIPITAGGRLTGKIGPVGIGVINVQTDEKPDAGALSTNFSIVRLKSDILRRSTIGLIATRRSPALVGADSYLFGGDTTLQFFRSITVNAYYARSHATEAGPDAESYRAKFDYAADRYGMNVDHILVADGFNPEVGFIRRSSFRRTSGGARFSPRLRPGGLIRRFVNEANYEYITTPDGSIVENRRAEGNFTVDFNSSDQWGVQYANDFEFLPEPFQISRGVILPTGEYSYQNFLSFYTLGQQRRISGRMSVARGTFYNGHKTEVAYSSGRIMVTTRFNIEPGISLNWVTLPEGDFQARLFTVRPIITPTPRMIISGLVQYDPRAKTLNSSARLRWEYQPGSEIFVVYGDGRSTAVGGSPELVNRSLALKITRLVRF